MVVKGTHGTLDAENRERAQVRKEHEQKDVILCSGAPLDILTLQYWTLEVRVLLHF